jgi:hypothetical protein
MVIKSVLSRTDVNNNYLSKPFSSFLKTNNRPHRPVSLLAPQKLSPDILIVRYVAGEATKFSFWIHASKTYARI